MNKITAVIVVFLATLISSSAFAQTVQSQGVLDSILNQFISAASGQMTISQGFGKSIFLTLASIDLALFGVRKVLASGDLSDLLGGFTLKIFTYGFFWTLIVMGPTWIPLITQSFMEIGVKIGGVGKLITPSGVMGLAVDSAAAIWESFTSNSSWTSIGSDIVLGLAVIVAILLVIGAFALVAFQLIATQIELLMASSVGFFMLGFSGASFTTMFSEKYFGYIVSAGIKLVVICVLAGIGTTLSQQYVAFISGHNGQAISAVTLLVSTTPMIIYGCLALQLPSMAGALMNGAPSMTAGSLAGGSAAIAGGLAGGALAGTGAAAGVAGLGGSGLSSARSALDKLSVLAGGGGDVRADSGDSFSNLSSLAGSSVTDAIGNPDASSKSAGSSGQPSATQNGLNKLSDAQSQMGQHEGGGGGVSIRLNHLGD